LPANILQSTGVNIDAVQRAHESAFPGLIVTPVTKLGDIKYVYMRSWGDRERVFKIVSFFLLRYHSGKIDDVAPEMRVEVKRAAWIPLEAAPRELAYRGEREMAKRALQYLKTRPEV